MTSSDDVPPRWDHTILVVEDEEALRALYVETLSLAGYRVRHVADGVAALRLIEVEPPDLVVLDLWLPTLDGISVRDELLAHAETRNIPIVIVTAAAEKFSRLFRDDCVLRKPVTPEQLITTVRHCLSTKRTP